MMKLEKPNSSRNSLLLCLPLEKKSISHPGDLIIIMHFTVHLFTNLTHLLFFYAVSYGICVHSFINNSSFAACLGLKRLPPKIKKVIVYIVQVVLDVVKGEGKS